MKEHLKISKMILTVASKNGQPILKLSGAELFKSGFNIGDFVNVSLSDNQIIISKNKQTDQLQEMGKRNPSIKNLIEKFELSVHFNK